MTALKEVFIEGWKRGRSWGAGDDPENAWSNYCVEIDRADAMKKIEDALRIPSSGHASASELADTILDALGFPS